MVEPENQKVSISRQCELLGMSRSSYYYKPVEIDEEDLEIMKFIDKKYMDCPYYGVRRIRQSLIAGGFKVGIKRVRRLMRIMGIQAIYPKKRTSIPDKSHKIYPYLLRNISIDHSNCVWASDITYLPMSKGFMYMVAIIDIYSRKLLSWRLSNSMETDFCVEALNEAINRYGKPEIFNTDQGSQFTSTDFTNVLIDNNIQISMDGKGRWVDNVFVERFWRSMKYEDIYLKAYENVKELKTGLTEWCSKYNKERQHQSLDYKTPNEVYYANLLTELAA